ncbi:MAG: hypothetical protein ACRDNB_05105 [Gaiellaceae bacterium]
MKRRRLVPTVAVVLGSLVLAVTGAWAGFPNILRFGDPELVAGDAATADELRVASATTTALLDPRVLVEDIVVVGIQEGVQTRLTAPFEAVYVCVNGGENVPSAANKTVLAGELESSALFPAAKNGRATGSLLTQALPSAAEAAAATGFACPAGQVLEFDRVVFSGLVLSVDGGESIPLDTTLASPSVHGVS